MLVPPFWSRHTYTHRTPEGDECTRSALGWSEVSKADADKMAAERARRFATAAIQDHSADAYYSSVAIREPLPQSITSPNGRTIALVTRNRYGCRVLNTDCVLFADIDLTPTSAAHPGGLVSRIFSWFWPGGRPVSISPAQEAQVLERLSHWHQQTGIAARVYRTFAGLRLMVVDREFNPTDPATTDILKTLNTDPLYVQLTRRQECFRARLTPKPWRIKVKTPWYRSAIDNPEYLPELSKWAIPYEQKATNFAVCRLTLSLGTPAPDPTIQAIIQLHDSYRLNGDSPLA